MSGNRRREKMKWYDGLSEGVARALVIVLLTASMAFAIDGEVYFGVYGHSTLRARPDGGRARYVSGVELGHFINTPVIQGVRPWVRLETLMDDMVSSYTFHPSSIRYDLGVTVHLYEGLYFEVSHMCWHPIDIEGGVEQYNLFKLGYEFGR
jgi:hypothetical protein